MPLLLVDGPEGAGKTTLINSIQQHWSLPDQHTRHWGPVDSWRTYVDPIVDDVHYVQKHPGHLVIWDRSWAAEWVYNALLNRDKAFHPAHARSLEDVVDGVPHVKLILTATPAELVARRTERHRRGEKADLPVAPLDEIAMFTRYGKIFGWQITEKMPVLSLLDALRGLVPMQDGSSPSRVPSQSYEGRNWKPHVS